MTPSEKSEWDGGGLSEELKQLREQLHLAQQVIFDLLPYDVRLLVQEVGKCQTSDETRSWYARLHRSLQEEAAYGSTQDGWNRRSSCPLCHNTTSSGVGFTLPDGLNRHFEGTWGARLCPLMRFIKSLMKHQVHWPGLKR